MRARSCWIVALLWPLLALPAAGSETSDPPNHLPDRPTEGYAVPDNVVQGQPVRFHIRSEEPYVIKVWRDGVERMLMHTSSEQPATQPATNAMAWTAGAGWPSAYELVVAEDWPSGLYLVELIPTTLANLRHLAFVVLPAEPASTSSMVVVVPTNTWQAYNDWGGKSIYVTRVFYDRDVSVNVHFERPFETSPQQSPPGVSGQYHFQLMFIEWLESQGLVAEFVTDRDIDADPTLLDPYRLAVVVAVGEYYTREMFDALERVRDRGGSLLFMGSTNIHWAARLEDEGRTLTTWKSRCKADPVYQQDPSLGTCHWYMDEMGRASSSLTGVQYVSGSPTTTPGPCSVSDPTHWIFEGTGLEEGDLLGTWACGGELDITVDDSPPVVDIPIASQVVHKREPDRFFPQESVYHERTAAYGIPDGSGGRVYTSGTEFWVFDIDTDPAMSRITRNLIERLSAPSPSQDCDPDRAWIDGGAEACEPITADQAHCVEALDRGLARMAKTHGKTLKQCVKKAARGGDPVSACLGEPSAAGTRMEGAARRLEERRCAGGAARFGPRDVDSVVAATQRGGPSALLDDLLGDDSDGSLVLREDDPHAARCQQDVLRAAQGCMDARVGAFERCAKTGLRAGTIAQPSQLDACRRAEPDAKIARACSEKPAKKIARRCAGVDLAAAFPGCAADDAEALLGCVAASAECRACRLLGDAAQLPGVCETCPDE